MKISPRKMRFIAKRTPHTINPATAKDMRYTLGNFSVCPYCEVGKLEHIDHFMPIKLGGGSNARNLVPCCAHCNRLKWKQRPQTFLGRERFLLIWKKMRDLFPDQDWI